MVTRAIKRIAALALCIAPLAASADDKLAVSVAQINHWDNQPVVLGGAAGLFKKQRVALSVSAAHGDADTLQAVLTGTADIGIGVSLPGVLRAFANGAPVRILMPTFTGASDLYWYVKGDSGVQKLKDAPADASIAYATDGSMSDDVLAALLKQSGVKLKPVAAGNSGTTLSRVMAGEIDIGWSAAPFGLKEAKDGKIRIVARGSDLSSWANRTTRVAIVNAGAWKARNDEILRFVKAYREALDHMGSDAQLTKRFADALHQDAALVVDTIRSFYPKQALQTDRVTEIDAAMADAVAAKLIAAPLTKEQLAELIQIPPR